MALQKRCFVFVSPAELNGSMRQKPKPLPSIRCRWRGLRLRLGQHDEGSGARHLRRKRKAADGTHVATGALGARVKSGRRRTGHLRTAKNREQQPRTGKNSQEQGRTAKNREQQPTGQGRTAKNRWSGKNRRIPSENKQHEISEPLLCFI